MMTPQTVIKEGRKERGGGKDEEGSTSTNNCDYNDISIDATIYVDNEYVITEAVVVRFHPLMLQIVASPGVMAAVWD